MAIDALPRPRITLDNAPFWAACRRHELALPFCEACGKAHLPASPVCPFCFSDRLAWRAASGYGTISSWVTIHKAWFPSLADKLPYSVVLVELAEGPRLIASLVDQGAITPAVGDAVWVVFDDVDAELTLPRFSLAQPA